MKFKLSDFHMVTYELDLAKITAHPPVLLALSWLGVPQQTIAQACDCSEATVSGWATGKKQLPQVQAKLLIDFAAIVMQALRAEGDKLAALPQMAREKVLFRLRAANAMVGLQRCVTLGCDFCPADEEFIAQACHFAKNRH